MWRRTTRIVELATEQYQAADFSAQPQDHEISEIAVQDSILKVTWLNILCRPAGIMVG